MKRVLLMTTVLVLVMAFAAMAAEPAPAAEKGLVGYGIKAGLILANATGSDATPPAGIDKKMKMGFGGGAFLTYAFSPMFALQPELLYMMKGVKYEQGAQKLTEKVDYIEVPVLLKVTPAVQGKIKPNFFAGPFLGILMSAKEKMEGSSDPADNYDDDVKDYMKSTEFGVAFGLGADFMLAKGKITLDARYDLGLSKIMKAEDNGDQANTKTGTIAVFVGYSFK
jgi:hypothetical protein